MDESAHAICVNRHTNLATFRNFSRFYQQVEHNASYFKNSLLLKQTEGKDTAFNSITNKNVHFTTKKYVSGSVCQDKGRYNAFKELCLCAHVRIGVPVRACVCVRMRETSTLHLGML